MSLSARRAWIEIVQVCASCMYISVALRKESVDRNLKNDKHRLDRMESLSARRAWIEIICAHCFMSSKIKSLSARRAWIEIAGLQGAHGARCVALRKESVDRNKTPVLVPYRPSTSLSARRAWIEISYTPRRNALLWVALRKESVDRNRLEPFYATSRLCRSPQGERG